MPDRTTSLAQRFFAKVDITDSCWLWTASRCTPGYGQIRAEDGRLRLAHRVSYEMARGPIPAGLVIDHLCRVLHCVNPEHLEAVTNRENIQRGEAGEPRRRGTCQRGHEFTDETAYVGPSGKRMCRECKKAATARRKRLRKTLPA